MGDHDRSMRLIALASALLLVAACSGSDQSQVVSGTASASSTIESSDSGGPADTSGSTEAATSDTTAIATATPDTAGSSDTTLSDTTLSDTAPSDTSAPTTPIGPAAWREVVPDAPDCACSDGSGFRFFERPGDPSKVMFFFEGGGACFNLATCDPNSPTATYSPTITDTPETLAELGGLFEADNPANPLADYSIVYVPYCTGDVHIGDATTEYSPEVTIEHRGAVNARAALDHIAETYPDVEHLLVTGESAGSVPTPIMAGLASDLLPDAEIVTLGDSSGAYPDVPAVNALIGSLWGTTNAIPDWPENAGITAAEWSFPALYIQAGLHDPDITFARFDYASDEVQGAFSALAGIGSGSVVEQIDATEQEIEDGGTPLAVFVAPGTEHTIIGGDEVYSTEVDGVRLIDWITELVDGGFPADVHCVDCTP